MDFWRKIYQSLWAGRSVRVYPAEPSAAQVENARVLLNLRRSPYWEAYEGYLCVALGEAMERCFAVLKKADSSAVLVAVAEAEAVYRILTESANAESVVKKSDQIIIKPFISS